ncbi:membrane protein [Rhodococcus phage Apiary]|nr:membrane protein [Rhodococcus phage Braxoaddie]WNM67395.1 membrane protein [Rhodococcus phage Polyyuki]WNM69819.1 membrane protein [Rhodococcus phage Apiary]
MKTIIKDSFAELLDARFFQGMYFAMLFGAILTVAGFDSDPMTSWWEVVRFAITFPLVLLGCGILGRSLALWLNQRQDRKPKNQLNDGGGIGLLGLTFIVFLVLKLIEVIDWSWWWVTAPLWGPTLLAVVILIPVGIVALVKAVRA